MEILTIEQCESLENGDGGWVGKAASTPENDEPLIKWLHRQAIQNDYYNDGDFGWHEYEDELLDFEVLKEREAENALSDDDKFENLFGTFIDLSQRWSGQQQTQLPDTKAEALLQQQDMWKITQRQRGPLFNWMMSQAKQRILEEFRDMTVKYAEAARKYQVGGWERDVALLRKMKIIGMTTTGLCKNRAIVDALNPMIVLIEEAAESLEAPITAACVQSLEHLILVGDHRQLRPQCAIKDLEGEPVCLNVSLFERMVNNEVEFSQLQRQRRMIPEVRRLLHPIYGNTITDHPVVLDLLVHPPVPGMGGVNSFFFTHEYEETKDSSLSTANPQEANMVVGFFEYLVNNGVDPENITVLTFYNGQRKLIHKKLRTRPGISGLKLNVVTVDSYQGEENDIVLLSLVRSNTKGSIGFVGIENRICVALSRSKLGCYLFGNLDLLVEANSTWEEVAKIMEGKAREKPSAGPKCRVGEAFPIVCQKHGKQTLVKDPSDWDVLNGGCDQPCEDTLPCGHTCDLRCHPFGNEMVSCFHPCPKELPCGHLCLKKCLEECRCIVCALPADTDDNNGSNIEKKENDAQFPSLGTKERNSGVPPRSHTANGKGVHLGSDQFRQKSQAQSRQPPTAMIKNVNRGQSSTLHAISGESEDARHAANIYTPPAPASQAKRTTPGAWGDYANGGVYEHDKELDRIRSSRNSPEKMISVPGTTPSRVTKAVGNGRFQWTDTYSTQNYPKQDLTQQFKDKDGYGSGRGPSPPAISSKPVRGARATATGSMTIDKPGPIPTVHSSGVLQRGTIRSRPIRQSENQTLYGTETSLIDFNDGDELVLVPALKENLNNFRHASTPLLGLSNIAMPLTKPIATTPTSGLPYRRREAGRNGLNDLPTTTKGHHNAPPKGPMHSPKNSDAGLEDLMDFDTVDNVTTSIATSNKHVPVSILDMDD